MNKKQSDNIIIWSTVLAVFWLAYPFAIALLYNTPLDILDSSFRTGIIILLIVYTEISGVRK